jgi:hypothetical protein
MNRWERRELRDAVGLTVAAVIALAAVVLLAYKTWKGI